MESGKNSRNFATEARTPTRPYLSRRTVLGLAGAFGVATPIAMAGVARALTAVKSAPSPDALPLCRTAMTGEGLSGPPRALTLAWNATSVCTAAAPVAKERGVFAKHNLDVDFINFGGSTEQLLEAIATGKADAGIGMALRWLKPLEQGFDVRITAGVHGGCIRLLGSKAANIRSGTSTGANIRPICSRLPLRRARPKHSPTMIRAPIFGSRAASSTRS